MAGYEFCGFHWWFVFPLMIIFCFFLMRGRFNRSIFRRGTGCHSEESALNILNKRYARGEIDQDEYEEMKNKLT